MNPTYPTRIVASSLCAAVTALIWDGWWHIAVGRDTFWEPPHFILYATTFLAVAGAIYGWRLTKDNTWKHLALITLLIPFSAPFDDAWHRFFGVENLETVFIIWSPPHLVLFGGLIASLIKILPLLKRDIIPIQYFLGSYIFACILGIGLGIAGPLFPFGPFHIFGFWGAGALAAVLVAVLFFASRWLPETGASFAAFFLIALYFLQNAATHASWVKIPPFPQIPPFAIFFSTLIPGVLIDIFKKMHPLIKGGVAGFIYGALLYGFTSPFIETTFRYSPNEIVTAILSCTVGGVIGASFALHFLTSEQKEIV